MSSLASRADSTGSGAENPHRLGYPWTWVLVVASAAVIQVSAFESFLESERWLYVWGLAVLTALAFAPPFLLGFAGTFAFRNVWNVAALGGVVWGAAWLLSAFWMWYYDRPEADTRGIGGMIGLFAFTAVLVGGNVFGLMLAGGFFARLLSVVAGRAQKAAHRDRS